MPTANMTVRATVLAEPRQATTYSGIPVSILWLPYVLFSLLIIMMVCASFIRFHIKHGHKYQRRRAELWRRLNVNKMQDFLNQLQTQQVSGAMSPSPPNGSTNTIEVTLSPAASSVSSHQSHHTKKKKKKRRPRLAYTSNVNGSMVDVRVANSCMDTFNRSTSASSVFTLSTAPGPSRKVLNVSTHPTDTPEDEILLIEETL